MASHATLPVTPARSPASDGSEAAPLSWEQLEATAATHGPSFYLADLRRFEGNYRRFLDAFRARYAATHIGYSLKTNYLPAFVLRAHDLGAYAEAVSRFEYDYAIRLGVPADRIVYNGPIKRPDDLATALAAGAVVNIDSLPELAEVIELAGGGDAPVPVGIRCALRREDPDTRFGIDLTQPAAAEAVAALDASPGLRLAGLHCHRSADRSARRYRQRTRAMIALHREVLGGRELDYLDIGGGFASPMPPQLAAQLPSEVSTFEDYAEAVAGEMRDAYRGSGPALVCEPGMALLADTTVFVTRVETVKETAQRRLAVVDGQAFNVGPLRAAVNLPIEVVPGEGRAEHHGPWDVVGQTCMEADTLHRGYEGALGVGDYVVVGNVGAYTNVLNAPFIRATPPILELEGNAPGRVLRPGSTVDDLAHSYGVGR